MPTRRTNATFTLSDDDRRYLEQVRDSRTEEVRRVERARVMLAFDEGMTADRVAETVGVSVPTVYRCVRKALAFGPLAALDDLQRTGRPARITPEARAWIVALACRKPTELGYSYEVWTERLLSEHIRREAVAQSHPSAAQVSPGTVSKILTKQGLHPHKVKYYCERRDPEFETKMVQVLHVYQQVELDLTIPEAAENATVRVSYDEKPGIQAIGATTPDLPPVPGEFPTWGRDYEYVRHGTVSLLAGLDLATGEVIGLVRDRHRSREFIEFLQALDAKYPKGIRIQVILDNHSAHTSKETRAYLATVPNRFEFVFTPVHGSWLNLIESFFAKMTRQVLRHIQVSSKEDLVERLELYLREVNEQPVRFRWTHFTPLTVLSGNGI
ncbi:MAG: IS630 family transposase [Bacillota bacterium]